MVLYFKIVFFSKALLDLTQKLQFFVHEIRIIYHPVAISTDQMMVMFFLWPFCQLIARSPITKIDLKIRAIWVNNSKVLYTVVSPTCGCILCTSRNISSALRCSFVLCNTSMIAFLGTVNLYPQPLNLLCQCGPIFPLLPSIRITSY